jgi:hypothetical protein
MTFIDSKNQRLTAANAPNVPLAAPAFGPEGQPDISRGRKPPVKPLRRHAPEGRQTPSTASILPPLPGREPLTMPNRGLRFASPPANFALALRANPFVRVNLISDTHL